jgi:2-succinyl-5-enolpyruvyl-6-hydroxy-3-cyclohexene-1-carboxylate synthase
MNQQWSRRVVQGLSDAGVRRAVICPGGRSAPLALALAECAAIDAVSVLDERSAAFIALGVGKASATPAVVLCTSGSAGAHMLPAVIEADHAEVPLLIITADRPPEARTGHCRQTPDQKTFFAGRTRLFTDLGCPCEAAGDWPVDAARRAVQAATGPLPGPVHLNAPFRDPLHG